MLLKFKNAAIGIDPEDFDDVWINPDSVAWVMRDYCVNDGNGEPIEAYRIGFPGDYSNCIVVAATADEIDQINSQQGRDGQ